MDWPGEKLLIKLWETLADKGIGSLLKPWQANREGVVHNALRRNEILILAQAEVDASEIRAGRKYLGSDGSLHMLPSPSAQMDVEGRIEPVIEFSELVSASQRSYLAQTARSEINISKAVIHAEAALIHDKQIPPEREVDEDWLFTWRDYAGRVSSEELQQLWGSILAGEVKSPGGYSLRTLEFLRGVSTEEAEKISLLARFQIEGRVFRSQDAYLALQGVTFDFLLEMQNLGLLSGVEALGLGTQWKSILSERYLKALRSGGKVLVVEHEDAAKDLRTEVCLLTNVGRQILGLGNFVPDVEYMRLVGKDIVQKGFNVQLADWVQETENLGSYFNPEIISA